MAQCSNGTDVPILKLQSQRYHGICSMANNIKFYDLRVEVDPEGCPEIKWTLSLTLQHTIANRPNTLTVNDVQVKQLNPKG